MKLSKIFFALSIILLTGISAGAQAIKKSDKAKIANGVKSGELTKKESYHLMLQQRDIRQDQREAKADGVVTQGEKKEIRKDKRKADRSIYRKKHNSLERH